MSDSISFGAAQARLLSLLDDATRRSASESKCGVALTGVAEDMAVLGFMSLYRSEPVRCYAVSSDIKARAAAIRFGALHQTCPEQHSSAKHHVPDLVALARKDGISLITGREDTAVATPFTAPEIQALWKTLPTRINRADLIRAALVPLLGTALCAEIAAQ
ncbi:hypothetical protein [Roseobacter sp. A03A-229]